MLACQVEAAPLDRLLGRALQQLGRGGGEELGHVHLFRLPPGGRPTASDTGTPLVEEPVEEVVEEATSPQRGCPERRATAPGLRRVQFAEVLHCLALTWNRTPDRDDGRLHPANVTHPRGHAPLP